MRVLTAGGAKPIGETLTAGGATPSTGGSGGGSGGGGAKIEVLNKTGAVINQGDKVWLSEEVRIAGESFSPIGSVSNTNSVAKLSPSGNFLWFDGKNYSVGNNSVSKIGSSSFSGIAANKFKYGPNNQMFMTNASYSNYRAIYSTIRFDEDNQYSVAYEYIGEDLGYNSDGIHRINVDDGTISETWATTLSSNYQETHIAVNGVIYDTNSTWGKYIFNGTDWEGIYTITADNKAKVYPINATADKKYIIASTYDSSYWQGGLRIIEIIDEDHLKLLTVGEMPIDLQTFYDSTTGIAFNPSSGLLSVMKDNGSNVPTDFVIMKYNNGEWSKIPNTINLNDFSCVNTAVTVSNDVSRVCINGRAQGVTSSYIYPYIVNLTDVDGYSAIPYKPYTINENTITATALAESQPNELAQVQIGSVTNETLTVTENGKYTPSATYTGFGSVNVNVKGAEKIEAVNKTGSSIAKGDKVWVNENYQGEGNKYALTYMTSGGSTFGGCIDRTGTFGVANGGGYNIGETQGTFAYTVSGGNPKVLFYGDDNSILTCAGDGNRIYRIDGKAQFALNPSTIKSFCSKYLFTTYNSVLLRELNMTTGEYVKQWYFSTIGTSSTASVVVVDNTVYTFPSTTTSDKPYYADLPEESGSTITLNTQTSIANFTKTYLLPLGVTTDNRYIVMANGNMGGTSLSGVTFFEVLGKGQLKELSAGELPTDLQPYYSANSYIIFNPYTGILTACVNSGGDYVIMKYENGEWTKVAVENNFTTKFGCPITVSDDLSRVGFKDVSVYSEFIIYNLPTTEGYGAIAYNTRNITENTITGYAMTDAEPNETVTVSVPAEV